MDPLTDQPVAGLHKIMHDYRVGMDQIYIQSMHFDAETYLRAVHAHTGVTQMEGYLQGLEVQTRNRGKD